MNFTVYAKPQPQGSAKAFVTKEGKAIVTSDNTKLKPYRHTVTAVVRQECIDQGWNLPLAGKHVPCSIGLKFFFERPPSIPKRRVEMVVKPDIDKLIRATLDALKGVLFADDAQVVALSPSPSKHYGSPERVEISIEAI
jgi:Holliday junction resolvase RusA-like endonuclease